jgi:hypothetical protein
MASGITFGKPPATEGYKLQASGWVVNYSRIGKALNLLKQYAES